MRYIVCGLHRTGTSALVRAIAESSTLFPYVDPSIEAIIRSREIDTNYDPNPAGYFSHGRMVAPISDWIKDTPDESVMKAQPEAFLDGTGFEPLMVILTNRTQSESETSFARAFGLETNPAQYETLTQAQTILEQSENVTLSVVSFSELINSPDQVFADLAASDWPIDAAAAASTIDPTLYRNR